MSSIIEPIEQERNLTQSKSILFGIHFLILSKSGRRNHNRPLLDGINRKTSEYETECQCLVKAESEARACTEAPCVGKKFAVVNYPSEKIWLWRSVRPYTLWGEGNHVSVRRGEEHIVNRAMNLCAPRFSWREIVQEIAWPTASHPKICLL